MTTDPLREEIAIVGMAGRFPGAASVSELWDNLCAGVESIRPFTPEELAAAGVDPDTASKEGYVAAGAPLEHADAFDAAFFGFTRRESEIMDPQHRVLLECAWAALEDAGYDPQEYRGRIGVFGGVAPNTYRQQILETRPDIMRIAGRYPLMIGSEREYAITRIAFKLGLTGPALAVQTACSTSGVALHLACQSLLTGESDMALAGGARVHVPLTAGYVYEEDGILSPDGHCRVFDAHGRGTVVGSGAAFLVVKRLSDALRDGDTVRAIVKGTAVNNDGMDKIGFTAPSASGQAAVIREALDMAEVDASTIGYVEAHGTGTFIGDPIEVAAITEAYRRDTEAVGYCGIGSIKSNIGHLDAGAGVAGVIKAVKALETGLIPFTLHFEEPNPQIDFASSPFRVVDHLTEWPSSDGPRRAAVSSFGLGGTNAHIVLEQAPPTESAPSRHTVHVLGVSARTPEALERASAALADHLDRTPGAELADVAHTLLHGRRHFDHRRIVVADDGPMAAEMLRTKDRIRVVTGEASAPRPVVFMFPGVGSQYPGMARGLYESEPVFHRWFDTCADLAREPLGADLRQVVYEYDDEETAAARLNRAKMTMPALLAVEYATAKLLETFGIIPDAMIGHSLGEYTAAALAGVLTLEDAMSLVVERGLLFDEIPEGSMLIVPLPENEVEALLGDDLSLAVVNRPDLCVVAGEVSAVDRLAAEMEEQGVEARRVEIAAPTHSHLIDAVLDQFTEFTRTVEVGEPRVPVVSGTTGDWLTSEDALDPTYWARHLRHTVRFHDGMTAVLAEGDRTLIEVGPGQTMSVLARRHPDRGGSLITSTIRHPREQVDDRAVLLAAIGRMWTSGMDVDLGSRYAGESRRRVPLPTYPFARDRYWIEPGIRNESGIVVPTAETNTDTVPAPADESPLDRPERLLAEIRGIFHELSGIAPSDLDGEAGFLELGFDSLFMTQAAKAVGDRYGMRISFRQLFEDAPTLRALAGFVDAKLEPEAPHPRAEVGSISHDSAATVGSLELAVTEGQQEILLAAAQDDESNAAYNLSNTLHIRGPVDLAALNAAVNALIARHDSLRVTFDPGMTRQRIAPHLEIDVTFVDLTTLDPAEADAALDRERATDVDTPFDLVAGPLVRARLIKRAANDHHFFLTVHHAVCDGWSSGLLLRRLAELYTAIRRGEEADLPPAMSLAEYVDWFEQYRSSDSYRADKDFWVDYIGTHFPLTDLPADRPRPPVRQTDSHRTTRRIDRDLLESLQKLATAEGVTLFTLLLGSLECTLARLTDQDEVGLALSIAGHTRFADRDLVAHAVNALPLRRPVARDGSFSDHLASTRAAFFDAFEHQDFSYGAIVRHTGAARVPGRTPLVSTTFNMGSPSRPLDMDGATAVPGSNPRSHEIFDAFINVVPHDDHLMIECTYNTGLFDRQTIDRRLAEWTTFLEGLVQAGPAVPVGQVDILPPAELDLLEQWNSTAVDFGPPATIVSLLEGIVQSHPESMAVVSGEDSLTYSELEKEAGNVAAHLSGLGVGRGSMVGVLCRPSVGMLTGIYGVLMAGAAYVPLDPDYPPERIAQVLDETRMEVVLSQDEFRHLFDGASVTVVDVEGSDFGSQPDLGMDPLPTVDPDDTAYVIYTSGSTGRPKGVMVEHRTVANLLRWLERTLEITPSDRLVLTKPIVFDASVVELFGGVTAGAGLVIPDSDPTDLALLIQTIIDHQVSILQLVPSMLGVFLYEPRVSECRSLRMVVSGGEPLPPELCSRVFEVLDAQMENHYGPTETTVVATAFRCRPEVALRPTVPIGRPIANVRVHIVDRELDPVPIGVVGEVCIAGAQVAAGYLDRPELTAERFVEEPGTDGEPMYRTGDLGRWLSDGTIEYLGRGDTQIKLRGYRIELGEIEARLLEHPDVTSAAVIVDGVDQGQHLVAYLAGTEPRVDELKGWLRSRVPPYMIPTAWAVLDKMPTTVSGKVDRRSLPKLEGPPEHGGTEFVAPRTPIEEEIAGIWEEVIGVERVGINDDFFDLGGHSLTAMQANARLRAAFDIEITLADFRTHSTVGDQALLVTQLLATDRLDDELMAAVMALGSPQDGQEA